MHKTDKVVIADTVAKAVDDYIGAVICKANVESIFSQYEQGDQFGGIANSFCNGIVLPDGVKALIPHGRSPYTFTAVCELKPAVRNVHWIDVKKFDINVRNPSIAHADKASYYGRFPYKIRALAMPYMIMVLTCTYDVRHKKLLLGGDTRVFWRTKPLTSIDDDLYIPALLNVNGSNGAFCSGRYSRGLYDAQSSIDKALYKVVHDSYSSLLDSGFNVSMGFVGTGLYSCLKYGTSNIFSSPDEWEKQSQIDPNFVLKLSYPSARSSLRNLTYVSPLSCASVQDIIQLMMSA